jgi:hypothetical protein
MSNMKIQEYNVETGENIVRDGTPEEIAKWEESKAIKEQVKAELAETVAKRQALLERLGITEEEARLLLA